MIYIWIPQSTFKGHAKETKIKYVNEHLFTHLKINHTTFKIFLLYLIPKIICNVVFN